jgi:hypothetical protein
MNTEELVRAWKDPDSRIGDLPYHPSGLVELDPAGGTDVPISFITTATILTTATTGPTCVTVTTILTTITIGPGDPPPPTGPQV